MELIACLVVSIFNHNDFPSDKCAASVPDTQPPKQPPDEEETNKRTQKACVPNQHFRLLLLQVIEKRAGEPLHIWQSQRPQVEEEAEDRAT